MNKSRSVMLSIVLALTLTLSLSAQEVATRRMSINRERVPLREILNEIQTKTDYKVFYSAELVQDVISSVHLTNATVDDILKKAMEGYALTYKLDNDTIVISATPLPPPVRPAAPAPIVVSGVVRDENNEPMPFAAVVVKGTTTGTATLETGAFSITVPSAQSVLQVSFMGYEMIEVRVDVNGEMMIKMNPSVDALKDVVVTGMFERRLESFTGSAQSFNRERLRQAGNTNLLQSLRNIDPSFNIMDNLIDGSNPNVMPEIQLRGQSGFPDLRGDYQNDPNQPLFILDGFEASLTTIIDLDMNRVESITLLKDAAAKAIYGSKAANGVVVIETVRPKSGRLQISYTGSLDVVAPDLTSYNLTNAAEQLELEWLWRRSRVTNPHDIYVIEQSYNHFLEDVLRGVDTYWLSQPLRVGYGSKHAVNLTGGENRMTYGVDLSFNNQLGVMKGSNRNTAAAGITLAWRFKTITLRNMLTATYNLANNSPYGSFDLYAAMKPYYRPYDENGEATKALLDWNGEYLVANPVWNAAINTLDNSEYFQFRNNLYLEWMPIDGLRLTGRVSIDRQYEGNEIFYPASHTNFVGYTTEAALFRRGEYTYGNGNSFALSGDLNAGYSRHFGKHFVMGNINWSINNSHRRTVLFVAEGFPNDYLEDITFARQYSEVYSRPSGNENTTRNIGITGAANYSYDNRYLFDASIRMSGSSQFGNDNRWGQFWAIGLGWNLHNEAFMEGVDFINLLKIRGSVGYTGSENFNSYQSKATYIFNTSDIYKGRFGAFLMGHENPGLRWQRKYDQNIGVDAGFFNNSLSVRFDYYVSNTDDLLTDVTIPSSTGFRTYKENLGSTQNRGFEANLRYRVWNNPQRANFVAVFVSATHNKNRIREISNSLALFNEEQTTAASHSRPIVRYEEGQSMSAIWVVPSYGIDPMTGSEIYIRPDGATTYTWSSDYLAIRGDREPTLRGNGGINVDYEGFSLNVIASWRFGGQIYNQTLVDKVDAPNITARNSDRRVYTDRWRNPGDKTRFKNVQTTALTRATERFVEDQNELTLSSIYLSYDLNRALSVEKIGLTRLRLSFNMNDIATFSTVKLERGTKYPFARTFSFSLQANF